MAWPKSRAITAVLKDMGGQIWQYRLHRPARRLLCRDHLPALQQGQRLFQRSAYHAVPRGADAPYDSFTGDFRWQAGAANGKKPELKMMTTETQRLPLFAVDSPR
jgi:hypothetical protein